MIKSILLVAAVLLTTMVVNPRMGATDEDGARNVNRELKSLRQQVAALTARVADLERLKTSFTGFMPEVSERFHVMHSAGEQGDWAVAQHELNELKRLTEMVEVVDKKFGPLFKGFLSGHWQRFERAIEHKNVKDFRQALVQTVASCNQCHVAAGSPFITVGLNMSTLLSLRHSHVFKPSMPMTGHTH